MKHDHWPKSQLKLEFIGGLTLNLLCFISFSDLYFSKKWLASKEFFRHHLMIWIGIILQRFHIITIFCYKMNVNPFFPSSLNSPLCIAAKGRDWFWLKVCQEKWHFGMEWFLKISKMAWEKVLFGNWRYLSTFD